MTGRSRGAGLELSVPLAGPDCKVTGYFPAQVAVGGVEVEVAHLPVALGCLRRSGGLMIRQPLAAIGSPLAECDYHSVAAPYRARFLSQQASGRGAAGRPLAKQAFCLALEDLITECSPPARMQVLLRDALEAFAADSSYATSMARSAVDLAARAHRARLLQVLRQSAHQAVSACDAHRGEFACHNTSPCGTGDCRFVQGQLSDISIGPKPGKTRRPANHVPGGSCDPAAALAEFERLEPFIVGIPVCDGDQMAAAEHVPGT